MSDRTRVACKAEFTDAVTAALLIAGIGSGEHKSLKKVPDLEKDADIFLSFLAKKRPESDGGDIGDRLVAKFDELIETATQLAAEYPTLPKIERGAHLHGGRKPRSAEDRAASFLE